MSNNHGDTERGPLNDGAIQGAMHESDLSPEAQLFLGKCTPAEVAAFGEQGPDILHIAVSNFFTGIEDPEAALRHTAWRIRSRFKKFLDNPDKLTDTISFPLIDGGSDLEKSALVLLSEILLAREPEQTESRSIERPPRGKLESMSVFGSVVIISRMIVNIETGRRVHTAYSFSKLLPILDISSSISDK